jgi:hypothetical protein
MRCRLLCAAFGTRGDLFPLLETALQLTRRGHSVLFLTHEAHREHVENAVREHDTFRALFTESLPIATADAAEGFAAASHEDLIVRLASVTEADGDQQRIHAVVVNLFALDLWHLAEKLELPFVIVSPSRPPNNRPRNAAAVLKAATPELFHLLCDASSQQADKICMIDFEEW